MTAAIKAGEKLNITPGAVAKQAVNAIFSGKTGTITGFINQPGSFLTWLLPKKPVEKRLRVSMEQDSGLNS